MDFREFSKMVREREMAIHTEDALRRRFEDMDSDGSGFIEQSEVDFLLEKVRHAEQGGSRTPTSSSTGDVHSRMDELDSKFQSRMDAIEAKLDELLRRLPMQGSMSDLKE